MTSKKSAERFSPDAGFLMSTLGSEETGIDRVVICVCAGEFGSTGNQLGPRLLVVLGDRLSTESLKDATTVQLTSPPQLAASFRPGSPGRSPSSSTRTGTCSSATGLAASAHGTCSTSFGEREDDPEDPS